MIIADTSILLMIEESRLRLDEVIHELAVLSPCYEELAKLSSRKGRKGRAARVALMLLEKRNIPVIEVEGNCDDAIVEYAVKHGCAVATADEELIKRLRMNRIEVLNIKGKILTRGD